ncbi:MAG TPA: glycosyltransferase family 39 protein, partial [Thermoanaerobaculia bacterium]|nr:glycosyltransferase family 39 protein [Thermoanaerobaculia bacterium]
PPLRRLSPARRAGYGYLLGVAAVAGTLYAASHVCGVPLRTPAVWTTAALPTFAGLLAAVLRRTRRRRAGAGRGRAFGGEPGSEPVGEHPPLPARHAGQRAPGRRSRFHPAAVGSAAARWLRRLGGPLPAGCVLVAALVCCGLLAEAASDPVHDWDGRMTWTAQARYIRAAGTVDAEALRNGRWYVSHPQYPLLLPIAQVAALEAMGAGPESHLQRGIYAAFYPVLLLLIYDGARRGAGRTAAALAVAAAAGVPFFAFGEGGAFSTYSDLPLACFYGAALLLLLAPRPDLAGGLAAGLLLAAAALTKNEGTLLALLALALGWRSGAGRRRAARRPTPTAAHEVPAGLAPLATSAIPIPLATSELRGLRDSRSAGSCRGPWRLWWRRRPGPVAPVAPWRRVARRRRGAAARSGAGAARFLALRHPRPPGRELSRPGEGGSPLAGRRHPRRGVRAGDVATDVALPSLGGLLVDGAGGAARRPPCAAPPAQPPPADRGRRAAGHRLGGLLGALEPWLPGVRDLGALPDPGRRTAAHPAGPRFGRRAPALPAASAPAVEMDAPRGVCRSRAI